MKDYYFPLGEKKPRINELIKEARKRNHKRDRMERASGFKPESSCPLDMRLRTLISALSAALVMGLDNSEQKNVLAESIALCQDIEQDVRGNFEGEEYDREKRD